MILDNQSPTIKAMYHGSVDASQNEGILALIASALANGLFLKEQIAYILATAYHETGRHMQGIDEYGKGAGHTYGVADATTHQTYYGRGIVQLTWKANYEKFGSLVGIDLVHNPERANELMTAVKIAVVGMKRGAFTGVGLERYVNQSAVDYFSARKVINSEDCAALIADYAVAFAANLHEVLAQVA